jgi:hypothetical protein
MSRVEDELTTTRESSWAFREYTVRVPLEGFIGILVTVSYYRVPRAAK